MRTEELYLTDIVEACDAIGMFIAGLDKNSVLGDDLIISAVIRKFEVIGEACSKLRPETRQAHPEIDWRAVIGFRNILAHQYFASNLDIIWEAASQRVGVLKQQIQAILQSLYPKQTS
jgi:uncharacterized protein with HEPN domain